MHSAYTVPRAVSCRIEFDTNIKGRGEHHQKDFLTAQTALHTDNVPNPKLAQIGHSTKTFRDMTLERVRGQVQRLVTTFRGIRRGGRRGLYCYSSISHIWAKIFLLWLPKNYDGGRSLTGTDPTVHLVFTILLLSGLLQREGSEVWVERQPI